MLRVDLARAQSNEELQREVEELKRTVQALEQQNEQLQGLDQRVKTIDRKLEIQQDAQREASKVRPVLDVGPQGFFLKSADDGKTFQMRVGGWLQADSRWYLTQTKPTGSEFLMRRLRPYLQGTVDEYYDFQLMLDFGQGATTVQDAFADIHYWPEFRLRAGKFKVPVGLERLVDDRYLKFVERALPSQLVPDRDIGFDFHGDLLDQSLEYAAGLFNGVPSNTATVDADNNDAKDFAARVFAHPFRNTQYEFAQKLALGVAGIYGDERASTLDTYKSAGQTTFFTYLSTVVASGPRYRIAPQAEYTWGPFGLLGEWVEETQRVRNKSATTSFPQRTLSDQAWQVAASYMLTGEDETYGPMKPLRNFSPFGGGLGAWELVARIDQLLVDHDAFKYGLASPSASSQEAFEFALGANWYLNQNVKFQLDYEHTGFRYGAPKNHDRTDESGILTELQLQF
jgi:phosphate-selective porin OprO and OprP